MKPLKGMEPMNYSEAALTDETHAPDEDADGRHADDHRPVGSRGRRIGATLLPKLRQAGG